MKSDGSNPGIGDCNINGYAPIRSRILFSFIVPIMIFWIVIGLGIPIIHGSISSTGVFLGMLNLLILIIFGPVIYSKKHFTINKNEFSYKKSILHEYTIALNEIDMVVLSNSGKKTSLHIGTWHKTISIDDDLDMSSMNVHRVFEAFSNYVDPSKIRSDDQ